MARARRGSPTSGNNATLSGVPYEARHVWNEPRFGAFSVQEGLNMNREHVKAAAKKVQGTVKQVVAEVTGDYNLDAEG